jgi:hypothetical protein
MRIGILADIHDAVGTLRAGLTALRQGDVEHVVTLGDAFDTYQRGEPGVEVASLLNQAGAIGVWGNHDAGLVMRSQFRFAVWQITGCSSSPLVFSHSLFWGDADSATSNRGGIPRRVEDLWGFDGVPDTVAHAERSFEAVPERIIFLGHFHSWLAMRRSGGRVEWDGASPIRLCEPDRYLVVVAPVVDGWCAMFDTEQCELTPIRCFV